MTKPSLLLTIILIVCVSVLAAPTLAHLLDGLGFFGGSLGLPDVQQCLVSMRDVHGCFDEFVSSVLSVQPQLLGPSCCEAFLATDENCWPKVFPLRTTFPPQLKNYCVGTQGYWPKTTPCYEDDDVGSDRRGDCDYY